MERYTRIFQRIEPKSIREAYSLRTSRIIVIIATLGISMTFGYVADVISAKSELIAIFFLGISWFFFLSFFIILYRYLGLLFRFRKYLDTYIAAKINANDSSKKDIAVNSGVFEKLAKTESVKLTKILYGQVAQRDLTYSRYRVTYYPENGRHATIRDYEVYTFELPVSKISHHIYVDGKENSSIGKYQSAMQILKSCIEHNQHVELEGDFSKYFNIYYNTEKRFMPLTTLTPDVMIVLREIARSFDIEFAGSSVRIISGGTGLFADSFLNNIEAVISLISGLPDTTGMHEAENQHLKIRRPPVALL